MRPKGINGGDGPASGAGSVGRVAVVQPKLPISRTKQPTRGENINSHQIKAAKKHQQDGVTIKKIQGNISSDLDGLALREWGRKGLKAGEDRKATSIKR